MTNQAAEQRASFLAQPFVWLEQRDIQDIRDRNVLRYLFLFFMGAVIASVMFWALQYWASPLADASENTRNFFEWLNGLLQNAGTEFLGAFVTFYLIETLLRKRRAEDERKDREQLQARLDEDEERRTEELKVLQREVADNLQELQREVAKEIRDELRVYIQGQGLARLRAAQTKEERQPILETMNATGLLQEAYLRHVKLEGASLRRANLKRATLGEANLKGATLGEAKLQGAELYEAKLNGANLSGAELQGADLRDANLEGANLMFANLEGANLWMAKLEGANLWMAKLEGASLGEAKLQGAELYEAKLQGALFLTVDQLRTVKHLQGTTLPDGHQLPNDDTWQEALDDWVEHTAQFKEVDVFPFRGTFIVPTRTEANARVWDRLYGDGE